MYERRAEAKSSDIIIRVEGVFEERRICLIGGETYVTRALADQW